MTAPATPRWAEVFGKRPEEARFCIDEWQMGENGTGNRPGGLIAKGGKKTPKQVRGDLSRRIERQQALVTSMHNAPDFALHLRNSLGLDIGADLRSSVPGLDTPLTENELTCPTMQWEQRFYSELNQRGVTPRDASNPAFWIVCQIAWWEQRFLDVTVPLNVYLDPQTAVLAAQLAHEDPCPASDDDVKRLDDTTRMTLRWLCGISAVRGAGSLIEDSVLPSIWWKTRMCHLIHEATENSGTHVDESTAYHCFSRGNRIAWKAYSALCVKRVSRLSHPRSAAAVVLACNREAEQNGSSARGEGKLTRTRVEEIIKLIARRSQGLSIDMIDAAALADLAHP